MKKCCLICAYLSRSGDDCCHLSSSKMNEGKIDNVDKQKCKSWSKIPVSEIRSMEEEKTDGILSDLEIQHLEKIKEALK